MKMPQHSPNAPPNLREAIGKFRQFLARHKKRMLYFFSGTMAIVVIGLLVCPKKYISESKLFVRVGRESIGLDPTATTGQTLSLHESRENEITSVLDILESRVIRESVVDKLGSDFILDETPKAKRGPVTTSVGGSDLSLSQRLRREKAVRHLNKEIKKSHTKKSNVFGLSYRDGSPQRAQRILQTFVDEFLRAHIRANRTSGSFAFFEEQSAILKGQFETASYQLSEAKDAIHAVSVDQRRASLQTHLSNVESALLVVQADLDSTEAAVRRLELTLANLPETKLTQEVRGFPDDAVGQTRKRLYELELQEQKYLTQFTEKHPLVFTIRRQSEAARKILQDRTILEGQATNADNPTYQQLRLSQLQQDSQAVALRAKRAALKNQLTDLKEQMRTLNSRETSIVQLQQRVDLLRDKYQGYVEKLEQARIDGALEKEQISNINVVQPPSYVAKPVSPKKALILILAFLFAFFGAVCFALLSDYLSDPHSETTDAEIAESNTHSAPYPATTSKSENIGDAISDVEHLVEEARV